MPQIDIKKKIAELQVLQDKLSQLGFDFDQRAGGGNTAEHAELAEEFVKVRDLKERLFLLDQSIDINKESIASGSRNNLDEETRKFLESRIARNLERAEKLAKTSTRTINTAEKVYQRLAAEFNGASKKPLQKKPAPAEPPEPKETSVSEGEKNQKQGRIEKTINDAVNRINRRTPGIQKDMLAAIEEEIRNLDLQDGKIKPTVKNLSRIATLKNKISEIILTDDYKAEVKDFAHAFNQVTNLQKEYWKILEKDFKPAPLLEEIKKISIEDTVNKLVDSGINANVADPITDILRNNITTGGSYRQLTDQLRESLTSTKTPGTLEKYVGQIAKDSINTYNAQYSQTVSSDLGFEWYKYSNSDIETTRPFCDAMTDQPFFHVSEIPALLRAEGLTYVNKKGQRVPVPLYPKTGLPHGMKPETNASNFLILRGGYQCGHQCRPISAGLVPVEIKSRVFATPAYIQWAAGQRAEGKLGRIPDVPETPAAATPDIVEKSKSIGDIIREEHRDALDAIKSNGFSTHEDLLDYLPSSAVSIREKDYGGSYYDPRSRTLNIQTDQRINATFREAVMAHEIGHAIHNENELITFQKIDPAVLKFTKGLRSLVRGNASEIERAIMSQRLKSVTDNDMEQLTIVADILGSLTNGKHGWGHAPAYYSTHNKGEMEVFAHAVSFTKIDVKFADIHPTMSEVIKRMKKFISETLESIKNQT